MFFFFTCEDNKLTIGFTLANVFFVCFDVGDVRVRKVDSGQMAPPAGAVAACGSRQKVIKPLHAKFLYCIRPSHNNV